MTAAARRIIYLFETGDDRGDPSRLAVLDDGAGVSFGIIQTTDRAGSLDAVVRRYCDDPEASYRHKLRPYLRELERDATVWQRIPPLEEWLRAAGRDDPRMRAAQEHVAQTMYLGPAEELAAREGLIEPLTLAALYDTTIQSGLGRVWTHRQTFSEVPPTRGGDEHVWTRAYLRARGAWMERVCPAGAWRAQTLLDLVERRCWALSLPLTLRGVWRRYEWTIQP